MAWIYFRCTALSEKSEKRAIYCMIPNMIGKGKTLMTKGVRLTTEKHKELF